jgi:rhodanese-related sulfurtransferase
MKTQIRSSRLLLPVLLIILGGAALFFFSRPQSSSSHAEAIQRLAPATYVQEISDETHLLLDVRTPEEFSSGYIAGAVNIPVQSLAARLSEIPRDQPVVIYCRSGNRSALAAEILADAGYSTIYDMGGIQAWQAQGLPVAR